MTQLGGLYCITKYMLGHQSYDVRILACETFSFILDGSPTQLSVVPKELIDKNNQILEALILSFMLKFVEEEDGRNREPMLGALASLMGRDHTLAK